MSDQVAYQTQNAGRAWSFSALNDNSFRFELRDGDFSPTDAATPTAGERSDMVLANTFNLQTPLHLNFDLALDIAGKNDASYLVLGQLRANLSDGSTLPPPFDIDLVGNQIVAYIRYKDAAGNMLGRQIYIDPLNIVSGADYNFDVTAVVDPNGNGRLVLKINGQTVADYAGPLGYPTQVSASWEQGLYRAASAMQTISATYSDLAVETGAQVVVPDKVGFVQQPGLSINYIDAPAGVTDTFTAKISGAAIGYSTINMYVDGVLAGTTTANGSGIYSIEVPVSGLGSHFLTATSTDKSGTLSSSGSYPGTFVISTPGDPAANLPGNFFITTAAETFWVQNAAKTWSISGTPNGDGLRFEVRDRDVGFYDYTNGHTSERSEVAGQTIYGHNLPIDLSYTFNLEPGAPNTAYFLVLGQFHQDNYPGALPWGPPFDIGLDGERMIIDIKYSGADGNPVSLRLFTDAQNIVRGHDYDISIKVVFDPTGQNGRLVVTRDGVILTDYSGPIGYVQEGGLYWKEGIYRHNNATETIAASYTDLSIVTGDAVKFPDPSDIIKAPKLVIDSVTGASGDTFRTAHVSGTAKAGTTVAVYDGDKLVGSFATDASGRFGGDIAVSSAGTHTLYSVATNGATGQVGITAPAVKIRIDTAAQLLTEMGALSKDTTLGAIVITDTPVFLLTSSVQLSTLMKSNASALAMIKGPYSFLLSMPVTGRSYDLQVEAYDSTGFMTSRTRYSGSTLTYEAILSKDGSSVVKALNATNGFDISTLRADGSVATVQKITAAGIVTYSETRETDGSRIQHTYNATTGIETGYTLINADKSKLVVTLNIANQNYVRQEYTYDPTNKLILQERFTAAGVKIVSQAWNPDGSRVVHNYDVNGVELSSVVADAAGIVTTTKFGIVGKPYAIQASTVDKAGKLIALDGFTAGGALVSSEKWGADGSHTVFAVDSTGAKTGYTQFFATGTKTVAVYTADHLKIAQTDSYDAAGKHTQSDVYAPDGSHRLTLYDVATGYAAGYTQFNADGSKIVASIAAGTPDKVTSVSLYDTTGRLTQTDSYDANGQRILSDTYDATGNHTTISFDPASGLATGYVVANADGTSSVGIYQDGVPGQLVQVNFLNAAGQLTGVEKYGSDGSHATTTYAANGDALTQRFDAAGKLASQTSLHDNVRDESDYAVMGKSYAKQEASYDASDNLLWMKRAYANGNPAFDQAVAADGSQVVKQWNAAGLLTLTKVGSDGKVNEVDQFNLAGVKTVAEIRNDDGSREWHYFDAKTGVETNSVTTYADKSRVEANYAITGKDYVQQIATYDAKGGLVDLVRKHGDATHTLAFEQKVNADGSAEVHNYDLVGRETSSVITAADKSRDAFQMTYAGNDKLPATTLQTHYTAANVKQWADLTKADGSHLQTAFTDGAKLASHANVVDTFVGANSGHDTFSFAGHFGKDTIAGFQAAKAGGGDTIEFDTGLVADYSHLVAAMTAQGADTLIKISDTDTLLIKGVALTSLTADDFKFVHHDVLSV